MQVAAIFLALFAALSPAPAASQVVPPPAPSPRVSLNPFCIDILTIANASYIHNICQYDAQVQVLCNSVQRSGTYVSLALNAPAWNGTFPLESGTDANNFVRIPESQCGAPTDANPTVVVGGWSPSASSSSSSRPSSASPSSSSSSRPSSSASPSSPTSSYEKTSSSGSSSHRTTSSGTSSHGSSSSGGFSNGFSSGAWGGLTGVSLSGLPVSSVANSQVLVNNADKAVLWAYFCPSEPGRVNFVKIPGRVVPAGGIGPGGVPMSGNVVDASQIKCTSAEGYIVNPVVVGVTDLSA